ncbi:MAG TPA: hypothetical protein EYP85_04420 [Armatimonadetes bacterium]|nr:hypothetical protein [Armatimonadota bacterium]
MTRPPYRHAYEDDFFSSTPTLWWIVLIVCAMVGSFLFGRYVIGEHLRRSASPVRNVDTTFATAPSLATPSPSPAPPPPEPRGSVSIITREEEEAEATRLKPEARIYPVFMPSTPSITNNGIPIALMI